MERSASFVEFQSRGTNKSFSILQKFLRAGAMLPELEKFLATVICILFFVLSLYDLALLSGAVLRNKDETYVPIVYVFFMAICGLIAKTIVFLNSFFYLTTENGLYKVYMETIAKYVTIIHQLSHYFTYSICALMTIHRLVIVRDPKAQFTFQRPRLLIYQIISLIPIVLLVILPIILAHCETVFSLSSLNFETTCAYKALLLDKLVLIPITCSLINCLIFIHSSLRVMGVYTKAAEFLGCTREIKAFVIDAVPPPVKVARVRRYTAMRQLVVSTAAFMTFCELESLFRIGFPNAVLHPDLDLFLAYFRFVSNAFLNFFVFQFMTDSTKEMVRRLWKGSQALYFHHPPTNIIHVS